MKRRKKLEGYLELRASEKHPLVKYDKAGNVEAEMHRQRE
jgi:hypothetical protein